MKRLSAIRKRDGSHQTGRIEGPDLDMAVFKEFDLIILAGGWDYYSDGVTEALQIEADLPILQSQDESEQLSETVRLSLVIITKWINDGGPPPR